jgi:hypothetical protein
MHILPPPLWEIVRVNGICISFLNVPFFDRKERDKRNSWRPVSREPKRKRARLMRTGQDGLELHSLNNSMVQPNRVNSVFVMVNVVINNKNIYQSPPPQTALSLLLLHLDCLLITLCPKPPFSFNLL